MTTLANGHTNGVTNGDSSTTGNIYTAASLSSINSTLRALAAQEASIQTKLNTLLTTQNDLTRTLTRLDLSRAHLASQTHAARNLHTNLLNPSARTAKRLASSIHTLDSAQAAVKSTLEIVDQVAELKACVLGVQGCMGSVQDWEGAASFLRRARSIPEDVVRGGFAEMVVPSAEVPDVPSVVLEEAAEGLCGVFLRGFEGAAERGDGEGVTRFFKLFPLIGREGVGLEAYGRYVCSGVAGRARATLDAASSAQGQGQGSQGRGVVYVDALTKLFEHIAQIVEAHEPLVERHYGAGSMEKVIERIQKEADVQGGILLDSWSEERRVGRKLTDVKAYPFNFLVQSFLPQGAKGAVGGALAGGGTPRTGSPAPGQRGEVEDDTVDMKEVDALLNESATMLGRWGLYTRFLASKVQPKPRSTSTASGPLSTTTADSATNTTNPPLHLPTLLTTSPLTTKTSTHLLEPFAALTTFLFRRSVEKAFLLDTSPPNLHLNPTKPLPATAGPGPYVTTAVDDTMYTLSNLLSRTLATRSRAAVASVVPALGRVLGGDFFGMVQRRMRDETYPRAIVQGALPPEGLVVGFLVAVNGLDLAGEYVGRIVRSCLGGEAGAGDSGGDGGGAGELRDLFPFGGDAVFVAKILRSLEANFEAKISELINEAVEVLLERVLRPRLRPVLAETFRDVEYGSSTSAAPDEDLDPAGPDAEEDGGEDTPTTRFERGFAPLTTPLKRLATPRIYEKLLTALTAYLSRTLEKRLWSLTGRVSPLGALRLERDISGIIAVAVRGGDWALRGVFARCVQICTVVGMEEEEWDSVATVGDGVELERLTGISWKLDAGERRKARGLLEG